MVQTTGGGFLVRTLVSGLHRLGYVLVPGTHWEQEVNMRHLKTVLAVIGAAVVLVLAGNTVVLATTGQSLILGKGNSANNVTVIKRTTAGSVLKLETTGTTSAPITTTGKGKVTNLNADKIDDLNASDLKTKAQGWTVPISSPTSSVTIPVPLAPGSYYLGYSAYLLNGATDGGTANCYFIRDDSNTSYFGEVKIVTAADTTPGLSGSGFVTVGPSTDVSLYCSGAASWTTSAAEPIQITALKLDTLSAGNIVLPKKPASDAARLAAKK